MVGGCPKVTELWHEVVVEIMVGVICASSVCRNTMSYQGVHKGQIACRLVLIYHTQFFFVFHFNETLLCRASRDECYAKRKYVLPWIDDTRNMRNISSGNEMYLVPAGIPPRVKRESLDIQFEL